jgi:hypothetical protein
VLGQEHDLTDVLGVVHELAVDGLERAMSLAPHGNGAREILRRQAADRLEREAPALLPAGPNALRRVGGLLFELRVPVPIWLLAVGGQEIGPARAHVAGQMLLDQGQAVGLGIEPPEEISRTDLGKRAVGEPL